MGRAMHGKAWRGDEAIEAEPTEPALARLSSVFRELIVRCESSELVTGYRFLAGGVVHPIPPNWWNTEKLDRFAMCQLHPKYPFAPGVTGDGYAWIFISRGSLERFIERQPFAPRSPDLDMYLSPYLLVMLAVARSLQITPENQPKKEVVVEELKRRWSGNKGLSAKLVDGMATLLREPESQLGRARPKKNPKES